MKGETLFLSNFKEELVENEKLFVESYLLRDEESKQMAGFHITKDDRSFSLTLI